MHQRRAYTYIDARASTAAEEVPTKRNVTNVKLNMLSDIVDRSSKSYSVESIPRDLREAVAARANTLRPYKSRDL